jgi:hypothetical protein
MMPLPGENPMQQIPAPPRDMPDRPPPTQRADPLPGIISTLTQQIMDDERAADRERQQIHDSEQHTFEARERTLDPMRERLSQQLEFYMGKGRPEIPKPDLPKYQPHPIVNEKDYTSFGFMALAMGLIGGIASKGDWQGVAASLSGALRGYREGSIAVAKKDYQDFLTKYEAAKDDYQAKLTEYHEIMENQRLTISDQFMQYELAADRFNDQLMMFNAQHKDLDAIHKHIDSMNHMLLTAEIAQMKVDSQMGGAMSDEVSLAAQKAMYKAGVPLQQMVPGLSRQAFNRRNEIMEGAIADMVAEGGMTAAEAGIIIAQNQNAYMGLRASVRQQAIRVGGDESLLANLHFMAGKASQVMRSLGGNDLSPVLNAIARKAEWWTGDPRYLPLWYWMNNTMQESAKITLGGSASIAQLAEGARENATKFINADWTTPDAWIHYMVPALEEEGRNRVQNSLDEIHIQNQRAMGIPTEPVIPVTKDPFDTGEVTVTLEGDLERAIGH